MKKQLLLLMSTAFLGISGIKAQQAIDFSGTGNYAEAAYLLSETGFTIQYDYYIHTLQNYNGGVTFTSGSNPAPVDFYTDATGLITSFVGNGGAFHAMNPMTLNAQTWYNVTYVYDGGSAGIRLYIDGSLIGTHNGFTYNNFFSTGTFRIGDRNDGATNGEVKIDNLKIWSVSRSDVELNEDMTKCFTGSEAGLDILYKMEEGTGTTLTDMALANGAQDATITGTATWTDGLMMVGDEVSIDVDACDTYISPSGNYTWTQSGVYKDTLINQYLCDSIININLIVHSVVSNAAISEDVLCEGDTTELSVDPDVKSSIYLGNPNSTNLNDDETYPCVYGNYYEGAKHQILILASELTAMGLEQGDITGLEFFVDDLLGLTDSLLNFEIKMATTSVSDLTTTFETPTFTSVSNVAYYKVGLGTMRHVFTTPFNWDGSSNIIIETCYNNDVLDYTVNPAMFYSPTSFNSVSYYNDDDYPGVCSEAFADNVSTDRPNMRIFGNTSEFDVAWSNATGGIVSPNDAITDAVPSVSGQFDVTVNNAASGCSNQENLMVTVNANPIVDLGNDITQNDPPVTIDAGAGFASYDWSNGDNSQTISVTAGGEYSVTVTDGNGCSASDTIEVIFTAGVTDLFASDLTIYPNPTIGNINIDLGAQYKDIKISVMNGLGQILQVKNYTSIQKVELDIAGENGVYFIEISNQKQMKKVIKVIKH